MRTTLALTAVILAASVATTATAQRITGHLPNPNLEAVFPPGVEAGKSVSVQVFGRDLTDATELRFSNPKLQATAAEGKGKFIVTAGDGLPQGVYQARVLGKFGLSTPRAFVVGGLPEMNEAEPNDTITNAQPLAVNSTVNGTSTKAGDLDVFQFTGTLGQTVEVRCRSESIDSRMVAMLTLRDAGGRIVAEDHSTVHQDACLVFTPEADGDYFLEVHDLIHEGSVNHFYRLTLTTERLLEYAFPGVLAPEQVTATTFGRSGEPVRVGELKSDSGESDPSNPHFAIFRDLRADGRIDLFAHLRRGYHVTAPKDLCDFEAAIFPGRVAGPQAIPIARARGNLHVENFDNDQPGDAEFVDIPVEISGRFHPSGDRDWFRFAATKGEVWEIEVVSQRLGVAADPFLLVFSVDDEGNRKQLASVDDSLHLGYDQNSGGFENVGRFAFNSRTDDPSYRFVAPHDGEFLIMVRELNHQNYADKRFTYRLVVRKPAPDFRLVATAHTPVDLAPNFRDFYPYTPVLHPGGTARIDLQAFRWGDFAGDIHVIVEGLPPGVSVAETSFPKSRTFAPLTLIADADAKPWAGTIRIYGEASIDAKPVRREATAATVLWKGITLRDGPQSRIMLDMPLSIVADPARLAVTIDPGIIEAKAGDKLKLPVSIRRGGGFDGPVMMTNIGLPKTLVSAKPITLGKDQSQGEVELTINSKAQPGDWIFCLDAKIDLPDPRVADPKKAKSLAVLVSSTPVRIRIIK